MTDLDISTGTNMDYFIYLITFWVVLVGGFLFIYRYVWPTVEHMYWTTARKLYWALRNYCAKDGYDGYKAHLNTRRGWK
jgi:hypothetical protein